MNFPFTVISIQSFEPTRTTRFPRADRITLPCAVKALAGGDERQEELSSQARVVSAQRGRFANSRRGAD